MPEIEIIKNYRPTKRINELKREEEQIYQKLLKLERF